MKALKSILTVALALVCTGALAQNSLKETVAPGNKVYVQIPFSVVWNSVIRFFFIIYFYLVRPTVQYSLG